MEDLFFNLCYQCFSLVHFCGRKEMTLREQRQLSGTNALNKTDVCQFLLLRMLYTIPGKACVYYMLTFFYELPPPLAPFCELLCVAFFNTRSLMKTIHEIITEPITIIYPFHCSLVVSNLKNSKRNIGYIVEKQVKRITLYD